MRNKSLFKLIAILMLAVGLIVTPAIDFFEPAVAVAANKKTAKKKTSKRKSTKQKSTKQKSSSKNQGTLYRCARCGVVFSRGIDPACMGLRKLTARMQIRRSARLAQNEINNHLNHYQKKSGAV